jgi:hypothetical protein
VGVHTYHNSLLQHIKTGDVNMKITLKGDDYSKTWDKQVHYGRVNIKLEDLPAGDYSMDLNIDWDHQCCHKDFNIVLHSEEGILFQDTEGAESNLVKLSCPDEESATGEVELPKREVGEMEKEYDALVSTAEETIDSTNAELDEDDKTWTAPDREEEIGRLKKIIKNTFKGWSKGTYKKNTQTMEKQQRNIEKVAEFYQNALGDLILTCKRRNKESLVAKCQESQKTVTTTTTRIVSKIITITRKVMIVRFKLDVMTISDTWRLANGEFEKLATTLASLEDSFGIDMEADDMKAAMRDHRIRNNFAWFRKHFWGRFRQWGEGESKIERGQFAGFNNNYDKWWVRVRRVFIAAIKQLEAAGKPKKAEELNGLYHSYRATLKVTIGKKFFGRCRKALDIIVKKGTTLEKIMALRARFQGIWEQMNANWTQM